jgi:hypothetical protein
MLTAADKELIAAILQADIREKARARPKGAGAVGKKRPSRLITPSALVGKDKGRSRGRSRNSPGTSLPWWLAAPPLVWVDIITGEVLMFRWPLPDVGISEEERAGAG